MSEATRTANNVHHLFREKLVFEILFLKHLEMSPANEVMAEASTGDHGYISQIRSMLTARAMSHLGGTVLLLV